MEMSSITLVSATKEVKEAIKTRPLLLYILGVPVEQVNNFLSKKLSEEEVYGYREKILNDRIEKTANVRKYLQRVVNYRECVNIAKKIRLSDTYLRNIIEGKNLKASYDMLDKIELFLSNIEYLNFEPSIGNQLTIQDFLLKEVGSVTNKLEQISKHLSYLSNDITSVARYGKDIQYTYTEDKLPTLKKLESLKKALEECTDDLRALFSTYIK